MSNPYIKKRTVYNSIPVLQIEQKTLHLQGSDIKQAKSAKFKEVQTPLFTRAFTPRIACKKSAMHRRIGTDYNSLQTANSRCKGVQLAPSAPIQRISSANSLFTHQRSVSNLQAKEPRILYMRSRKSSEGIYPKKRNYLGETEIKIRKSSSEHLNDMWKYFEKKISLKITDGITKGKVDPSTRKFCSILEDLNISPVEQKIKKNVQMDKIDSKVKLQSMLSPIYATTDSSGMNDSLMSMIREMDRAM